MIYQKKVNNNLIIALDVDNEVILRGKGLGFNHKNGDLIEDNMIEQMYVIDRNHTENSIIDQYPPEYISLTDEVISYAKNNINNKLNANIILPLCDHIYSAVQRNQNGIEIKNMMLYDIKKFYKEEYSVGLYTIDLIVKKMNVILNENEAGFIALHFVNAQLNYDSSSLDEITSIIQEIETIVRLTFNDSIDEKSFYYDRFITHLKFFAERIFSFQTYKENDIEGLLSIVKLKYENSYNCVMKIKKYIMHKYKYSLNDDEVLYLSIHISRILKKED